MVSVVIFVMMACVKNAVKTETVRGGGVVLMVSALIVELVSFTDETEEFLFLVTKIVSLLRPVMWRKF